jgi:hypothetical protein
MIRPFGSVAAVAAVVAVAVGVLTGAARLQMIRL